VNLIRELVETTRETVRSGYYRAGESLKDAPSLVDALRASPHQPAVIAEVKPATPTRGSLKLAAEGFDGLMQRFLEEGAAGLSVLTEPRHFGGSLANLRLAVATKAPTLMKDFIIDEKQIDCAASLGASAILLIVGILPKSRVQTLIEYAHLAEREVLLECGSRAELEYALGTEAELLGVNNRDLRTFQVDLDRTRTITDSLEIDRPLVSLSGFASREDVARVRDTADAILVGSALMEGRTTVAELVRP
jgi:indole-3-glycerol phosphate synthase